jgi:hypothetical protein
VTWMRAAVASEKTIVVILDGLQSEMRLSLSVLLYSYHPVDVGGSVRSLCLLPNLPRNVAVILSCSACSELEEAFAKRWKQDCFFTLPVMSSSGCVSFCVRYFARFGKKLSALQESLVAETPETNRLPLFLVLVMEFLRVYAVFESVDEHFQNLLHCSLREVVESLLLQLEHAHSEQLIRDLFCAVSSARAGMTTFELHRLLESRYGSQLSQCIKACSRLLVQRNGIIFPFHECLKAQCITRYGTSHEELCALYRELGNVSDMCHQACASNDTETLRRALQSPQMFMLLSPEERHHYTRVQGTFSADEAMALVRASQANAVQQALIAHSCGEILMRQGKHRDALAILAEACRLAPALGLTHETKAMVSMDLTFPKRIF